MFWSSWELLSKLFLLTGDTNGACVQVANTGHDTTLSNHGNSTKSEFFSTKHGSNHDIQSRPNSTINTNGDTVTKVIVEKCRVGFRETKLPWATSMLDRRKRGSTSTTITTRNLDNIGVSLGNTTGDGSDTNTRDQLDRNAGTFVDGMQIVNQLCQILNTVDIVVRRRRDKGDTWLTGSKSGNVFGNLGSWQLTTFSRLGSLGHLNL
mmetsp:Transcript_27317/g.66294  ORF Transcript_27317/g.66294 Transcript_27317/m.66294 type:complete len:207 (+) Transcript_27317:1261-1881(+)